MFDYESNIKKPGALRPDPKPAYTFGANAAKPDFDAHPELRDLEGYEGVMKAGDILYMPAGMVHQVPPLSRCLNGKLLSPPSYLSKAPFALLAKCLCCSPCVAQVRNELTSYMITYQYLDFTGLKTMFSPGMDPEFAQGKDEWEPHLRSLGLECWDPRNHPGGVKRLADQGELSLEAFNNTERHPSMYKIISKSRCSCNDDRACKEYRPKCCGWGGTCNGEEPWLGR